MKYKNGDKVKYKHLIDCGEIVTNFSGISSEYLYAYENKIICTVTEDYEDDDEEFPIRLQYIREDGEPETLFACEKELIPVNVSWKKRYI